MTFLPFWTIQSALLPWLTDRDIIHRLEIAQAFPKKTMKVHPSPKPRNTINIRNNNGSSSNNQRNLSEGSQKTLKRLPHIFTRVLELPFDSDADVSVEEGPDSFRFVAETDIITGGFRAHIVEIHPGAIKIVVRPNGNLGFPTIEELELDMWRFRLPDSTRPELASAAFEDGELVVTVPKGGEYVEGIGNGARLVLVQ